MKKLMRFGCKLLKLLKFQRVNIFHYHWDAYVDHLDGKEDIPSRFHYLGVGFILSAVGLLSSTISLIGIFQQHAWLEDPWYRTAMFINFFPKEIRNVHTIFWYCYNVEAVLGLGYELYRQGRAPTFMRIYTARGQADLGEEVNRAKFKRFRRYCMIIAYGCVYSLNILVSLIVAVLGYGECYQISPTFYILWTAWIIIQIRSGTYIVFTVPFLLIMSAHYLYLLQQRLLNDTKALMSKRVKNLTILMKRYEQIVAQNVSTNRLLSEFNQFWSFYLYLWIQMYPIMITYLIYALVHNNFKVIMWITLYVVAIMALASNLLVVVYVCTKVSRMNRMISKSITYIFRRNLQASLNGNLRRHIHLQAAVDNVRLSKYFLRSISNQIINNKTYFLLIFKFSFIYIKLTNLATEN